LTELTELTDSPESLESNELKALNLSVGATETPVLSNIDLQILPGRILIVLGPNGSGKSTLLKTLGRQLPARGGSVQLNNENIQNLTAVTFARTVAYLPQSSASKINLSIYDYVSLGRSPHQKWWQWQASQIDKQEVEKALFCTGLQDLRRKHIFELSGGERQRASVALALAQSPRFLLLDEPTSHLDFKHQCELLRLLKKLALEQKLGLAVVLHDLSQASYLADDVLLLKKLSDSENRVAALGSSDVVLQQRLLEETFEVAFSASSSLNSMHYFIKLD
jgi:iron complex transport system ATP-binding protein